MKNIFIFALISSFTSFLFAQNSRTDVSNIEAFINQQGKYITCNVTDIGYVKSISVHIINATNHTNDKRMNGLMINYENSMGLKMVSYIDDSEISDLVKTMEDLKSNVFNHEPLSLNSNTYYSGHEGFRIGGNVISVSGKKVWGRYVAFGSMDRDKKIDISVNDFDELLKLLTDAKAKMGIN